MSEVEVGCPHYEVDKLRCDIDQKDPESISKNRTKLFCRSSAGMYRNCHVLMFDDLSHDSFDLRRIDNPEYDDLKAITREVLIDKILTYKASVFSACPKCRTRKNTPGISQLKLCYLHEFKVQKTVYLLQSVNGFNRNGPFEFKKYRFGPFSNEVTRYISIKNHDLTWYTEKIDEHFHLNAGSYNILTSLIDKYFKIEPYTELGSLASRFFVAEVEGEQPPKADHFGVNVSKSKHPTSVLSQPVEEGEVSQDIDSILSDIEKKYPNYENETGMDRDFQENKELLKGPIERLLIQLRNRYKYAGAIGAGSSGIILKVSDIDLSSLSGRPVYAALKFPKPRNKAFQVSNLKIIAEERELLSKLDHPNIVKVIACGEIPSMEAGGELPWYIMEFISPRNGESPYGLNSAITLSDILGGVSERKFVNGDFVNLEFYLNMLEDIASALNYLHDNQVIHCDLKPENIIVTRSGSSWRAMLIDLGYAHSAKGDKSDKISVKFTLEYAHGFLTKKSVSGSQPGAITSKIQRKDLVADIDFVSLGKTIKKIIDIIGSVQINPESVDYEMKYLKLVMGKLIYREINKSSVIYQDNISIGLSSYIRNYEVFLENEKICYEHTWEILEDLRRAQNKIRLEVMVPEFDVRAGNSLDIGQSSQKIVLTKRLKKLIEGKDFLRISSVTQLGLVDYVYPRAVHTRYEHSLGTYSNALLYIQSLWNDKHNPIFRSVMSKQNIESALLAALLHDVGFFPLAHDIEGVQPIPEEIDHVKYSARIVNEIFSNSETTDVWNADVQSIIRLISEKPEGFQEEILRCIVSGPIDSDKLDYLVRDGEHLGIAYSAGIDKIWLLKNLTVCWQQGSEIPQLCVYEKGRAAAESVAYVRYEMHSVAYWHHTVRIIKGMLNFALRSFDKQHYTSGEHYMWFKGLPFKDSKANKGIAVENDENDVVSNIGYTDYLQLLWLKDRVNGVGKKLIEMILQRNLFKRIIAIDESQDQEATQIYKDIKDRLKDNDYIYRLGDKIANHLSAKFPAIANKINELETDLLPSIIVDVPTSKNTSSPELYYVPELFAEDLRPKALSPSSKIWGSLEDGFSGSIGKIRVLCRPELRGIIRGIVKRSDILGAIRSAIRDLI